MISILVAKFNVITKEPGIVALYVEDKQRVLLGSKTNKYWLHIKDNKADFVKDDDGDKFCKFYAHDAGEQLTCNHLIINSNM